MIKRTLPLLLLFLSACYYDAENELYRQTVPCNATGSYELEVAPVINSKCLSCHNNALPSGNVNLEGYDNTKSAALSGTLMPAIRHDAGASAMPKGANKLAACSIAAIELWIENGAPAN